MTRFELIVIGVLLVSNLLLWYVVNQIINLMRQLVANQRLSSDLIETLIVRAKDKETLRDNP